jgi:putative MATE family efflux protein
VIAVPLLFAEVGETLIQFTDTALLGRVGRAELAAIGPIDAVLDAAIVPAVGLVEAMQILVARRVGQGRDGAVGETFGRALAAVGLIAVAVAVALRLAAGPVAELVISSAEVARSIEDFFRFGSWGVIFLALNLAYSSLWVGLGRPRLLVGATIVLVVTNLALSIVLIFGPLGLPALGIEGAGMGFLGAELAAFAFLSVQTARRLDVGGIRLAGRGQEADASTGRMVRLGTPIGLQALVEAGRWVAFFLIIERLGEDALAASSLVFACFVVFLIPSQAFAETVYTMISASLGRGIGERLAPLVRAVAWRALVATLPLLAMAVLLPDVVLSLFTDDQQLVSGARSTLIAVGLGMVVVVAAEVGVGAVFGTGDADAGFVIELIVSGGLVTSAALAALVLDLELFYVWLSLPVAAGVGFAASVAWLRSGRWRRVAV